MAEIYRYIGGAGTGKTTKLMAYIQSEADRGTDITDICFTSFATSQRDDVRKRISEIYPNASASTINDHIKTIHGAVLQACIYTGLIQIGNGKGFDGIVVENGKMMNFNPFYQFCEMRDMAYNPYQKDPLESLKEDGMYDIDVLPEGNVFFSVARYLKSNRLSYNQWDIPANKMGYQFSKSNVAQLLREWDDYKRGHRIWEHDDYITYALQHHVPPFASIIIFDEYQGVSPAQHAIFKMWASDPTVKRAYIAGDPNQAIYGFRGANPNLIREFDAYDSGAWAEGQMPVSYRCPPEIIDFADSVLKKKSNMRPASHHGDVRYFPHNSNSEFISVILDALRTYKQVFILSRFRQSTKEIYDLLLEYGIPYSGIAENRANWWRNVSVKLTNLTVNMPDLLNAIRKVKFYDENGEIFGIPQILSYDETQALVVALSSQSWTYMKPLMKKHLVRCHSSTELKEHHYSIDGVLNEVARDLIDKGDLITSIIHSLNIDAKYQENLDNVIKSGIRSNPDQLCIDTIHSSKGLEAPCVILDTAYSPYRSNECSLDATMMEEERRIYYVGCTRSKRALFLSRRKNHQIAPPLVDVLN